MALAKDDSVKKKQRLLDNDRQKYAQAVQSQMLKQADTISALKKENDKLRQELAATTGGSYNFGEQDKLQNLQSESEQLDRKVEYEKARHSDLENTMGKARMDMMQARRSMGGINITSDNQQLIEKQVRVLENRLDQALVKFNEALSFNKNLRQQIDNLRGERKVFQEIYKKLESELHNKKRMMADVIERSNKDYEERDAYQQQLEALKQAAREDAAKYEEHFQTLEAMMQQYKAAREQQQQQQALAAPKITSKQDTATAEYNQNKAKQRTNANDSKHEVLDPSQQEQEADLQAVVDDLKEATGIQDLDVLYHKFVKAEEHNFSMYNFVNELNSEVDTLESEIGDLREQLHSEKGDVQRRKVLKDLENKLADTEAQHEKVTDRAANKKETLDVVRTITQEVFTKIGCSATMAADQLGTAECTEINLLQFLGLIEHRTNEIMFAYNLAATNEMKKRAANKDEEARKLRDRRAADRQARIEAGETVADEDDYEDDAEENAADTGVEFTKAKFIGKGPAVAHGAVTTARMIVPYGLPHTNAGDAGADVPADDMLEKEEDKVLDHDAIRSHMDPRIKMRRDRVEHTKTNRPKKPDAGNKKPK